MKRCLHWAEQFRKANTAVKQEHKGIGHCIHAHLLAAHRLEADGSAV